jgi:hypothetical protein
LRNNQIQPLYDSRPREPVFTGYLGVERVERDGDHRKAADQEDDLGEAPLSECREHGRASRLRQRRAPVQRGRRIICNRLGVSQVAGALSCGDGGDLAPGQASPPGEVLVPVYLVAGCDSAYLEPRRDLCPANIGCGDRPVSDAVSVGGEFWVTDRPDIRVRANSALRRDRSPR